MSFEPMVLGPRRILNVRLSPARRVRIPQLTCTWLANNVGTVGRALCDSHLVLL